MSAYEDVQAKERALDQSTKLDSDTRKQLEIGTMAPLDVVNADSTVATDKQALISSQSNLNYQQLDYEAGDRAQPERSGLVAAPIIPTDRVNLDELPEEKQTPDELVQVAFKHRPELEQAVLSIKKDEITLRGARNALLPTLDVYGFYGAQWRRRRITRLRQLQFFRPTMRSAFATSRLFNSAEQPGQQQFARQGHWLQLTIPIRNRTAQADQARSLIEYRQAEMHLEQLYTQIRMQVVNASSTRSTNDRAQVQASIAAERLCAAKPGRGSRRSCSLGASTTANVLLQQRNLADGGKQPDHGQPATYAKDRALLVPGAGLDPAALRHQPERCRNRQGDDGARDSWVAAGSDG